MFKDELLKRINRHVKEGIGLEIPPDSALGDYAFPCFALAKTRKKAPHLIAKDLARELGAKKPRFLESVKATGPYVNFFIDKSVLAEAVLSAIAQDKERFGASSEGKGKTIVIDYSHPNIAKPFHIGHLRSTVIGDSLRKLFAFAGYTIIGINHLGDWGTQFGALIYAHLTWGDRAKLKKDMLQYLLDIYVRFNKEVEKRPELQEQARAWFKRLEEGDSEALKLWSAFKDASLEEFKRIYALLGVSFESWNGEAYYNNKIDAVIEKFEKKHLSEVDEGALIVRLDEDIPPLMLRKSDGSSTYAARDVAAALHRLAAYKPEKLIYVVGMQELHFRQLFAALGKLGMDASMFKHVGFGAYHLPEGKVSTRKGRMVRMEDVLTKTIDLARKTVEEKNPSIKDKAGIAHNVGIGAVKFGDLRNDRIKDITFDWDTFLDFEGDTGPFLQYTHARARSILRKAGCKSVRKAVDFSTLNAEQEQRLAVLLSRFPGTLESARAVYKPHLVAQYLIELARCFGEFYHACPVLKERCEKTRKARLLLVFCVAQVLNNGLRMLGIWAPEAM